MVGGIKPVFQCSNGLQRGALTYQNYLQQISEDVGYCGRLLAEPTEGRDAAAFSETYDEGCRLWAFTTDQMSWQLTNAADAYLKSLQEMM